MALGFQVATAPKVIGGAPVDQSFAAGFPVKAYLMLAVTAVAWDAFAADAIMAIGGSDGTRDRGVGTYSEDGQAASDGHRRQADKVLSIFDAAGAVLAAAECSHKNFTDGAAGDGVTVTWDRNDANAYRLIIIMFGDDDISNVYCGRFQAQIAGGFQDIVAPGFQVTEPQGVLLWWLSQNGNQVPPPAPPSTQTQAAHIRFGFATEAGFAGFSIGGVAEDASNPSDTGQILSGGPGTALSIKGGVPAIDGISHLEAWLANGFRIHWTTAPSLAWNVDYLLIKGGRWKLDGETTPAVPGNVAHAGLGTTGKGVIAIAYAQTVGGLQTGCSVSIGAAYDDGGAKPFPQGTAWIGDADNVSPTQADNRATESEVLEVIDEGVPAKIEGADVDSWDADGVTFDWHTVEAAANAYVVCMVGDGPLVAENRRRIAAQAI